jgi:AcrR family transcriptional regulator
MRKDELVKAAILRAAESVFQKWGPSKTTMEDIAREAGKGKSTLYYYFKNKDEVLEALAHIQVARIVAVAREEISKKATAKDQLIAYVFTTFREIRQTMAPYDIEREMNLHRALIVRVLGEFDAANEKAIETILRFGLKRGEFKTVGLRDIKTTTRAIVTVIRSLTLNLFIDNQDKQLIDFIIDLMSEGL